MMPQTQGAKLLYQSYLQPTLRRYSPKIDVVISHVTNFAMALYHMYQVRTLWWWWWCLYCP